MRFFRGAFAGALFAAVSLVFLSCTSAGTGLLVDYSAFPEMERNFLAQALNGEALAKLGITDASPPGNVLSQPLVIAISRGEAWTTWENSPADVSPPGSAAGFLPLSVTCMVPPALVTERKTNIALGSALRGTLIPLRELAPPYIALKVDGMDAGDPGYPLVLIRGLLFDYGKTGGGELSGSERRFLRKKAAALEKLIAARLGEPENETALFEKRPRLYRIAAGGDAMLGRGTEAIILGEGAAAVLGGTADLVRDADLALLNMEGVLTNRGEEARKTYTFRFDPRIAGALKNAGFDAVLLANNHVFDYGQTGLLDTLEHLEAAGIAALGAGRSLEAAAGPWTTDNGRVQVFGLASYGPEQNGWDGLSAAADTDTPGILHAGKGGAEAIKARLRETPGKMDTPGVPGADAGLSGKLDIVFFHGGAEFSDYPDSQTRALYTGLIAAGADLVIGSHPHVEQGFEWVLGKPVFWSLGDYVFDEMDDTPGGDMGLFIVLSYAGNRLVYLEPYAVKLNGPRTVTGPPEQLDRFYRLTEAGNPVK